MFRLIATDGCYPDDCGCRTHAPEFRRTADRFVLILHQLRQPQRLPRSATATPSAVRRLLMHKLLACWDCIMFADLRAYQLSYPWRPSPSGREPFKRDPTAVGRHARNSRPRTQASIVPAIRRGKLPIRPSCPRYVRRARDTPRQPHWVLRSAVRNADGRTSIDEEGLRLQTATATYPRNQLGVSRIRVRVRRVRPRWTAPKKTLPITFFTEGEATVDRPPHQLH